MQAEQRTTFIFSTHDPQLMSHSEETFGIRDGMLVAHEAWKSKCLPLPLWNGGAARGACNAEAAAVRDPSPQPPLTTGAGSVNVMLFKIAFRNILRNRRRSLMTGSAVAVGAMAMLVFGCYITLYLLRRSRPGWCSASAI